MTHCALRTALHNEVHARPSARVRLPALIVYVAVLNAGVSREEECAHLRQLPGQQDLNLAQLQGNFLRMRFEGYTVKWERHTEFTRYSIVQALPEAAFLGASEPNLLSHPVVEPAWMRSIPGRTVAAIQMAMTHGDLSDPQALMMRANQPRDSGGCAGAGGTVGRLANHAAHSRQTAQRPLTIQRPTPLTQTTQGQDESISRLLPRKSVALLWLRRKQRPRSPHQNFLGR